MDLVAGISREDKTRNLVAGIHEVIEDHNAIKKDPDLHKSLLGAARKLVAALETPVETIFRFGWQVPFAQVSIPGLTPAYAYLCFFFLETAPSECCHPCRYRTRSVRFGRQLGARWRVSSRPRFDYSC